MSWGTHRRNSILSIIFLLIIIPIAIYVGSILINPVTCFDGTQNGLETGIDCGGGCALLCEAEVIKPIVVWKRHFEVAPGIYNVVAMVENPNPDSGVNYAPYIFRLYDRDGVLLQERVGVTKISPKEIVPIVENTLLTGKLEPIRVSFEFTEDLVFEKQSLEKQVLVVRDEEYLEERGLPRINADIENTDLLPVNKIVVVAVVYDINNNAIASSSTLIDRISKDQSVPVVFTWPTPFERSVSHIEIYPIYDGPTK